MVSITAIRIQQMTGNNDEMMMKTPNGDHKNEATTSKR